MKKIELLAPAGSMEALKAAVNYGADAVYLGGTSFSARAFASNFDHDSLIEAVKYCHIRGVKVYMTINTLLTEKELENALNEVRFAYKVGVDALIIQDLGLFYLIKKEMPDFDLHASTQMHIHNISGIKVAKALGFKKAVIARESSLELIKEACKEDIEIECFIHGAICVSYSGQCLMSAVSKQRSANKGMCAQCCRLKYKLLDSNNKKVETDTDYLLSPKDMYLLDDIPSLIEAGVSSFKIEGRMKSPAYVGLVTSIYRKAIDSYYEGKIYHITKEEHDNLLSVFNRGFTNSYLLDNNADIFFNIRPNHMGKVIGKIVDYKDNIAYIRLFNEVNQFDGIRIINSYNDTGKILNELKVNKKLVSKAYKNEVISVKVDSPVKYGDKVVKTLDYKLENNINNYELKKRNIDLDIRFIENKNILIKCNIDNLNFNKEYDLKPDKAIKAPISKESLLDIFSKVDNKPFNINNFNCELGNAFMPKSKINELRRTFYEDLEEYILSSFKRKVGTFISLNNKLEDEINNEKLIEDNLFNKNPVINTKGIYNSNVITEIGGLLNGVDNKIAYYTLNITNSYSYELLKKLGFNKIILSSELTMTQIDDLINSYKERNKVNIRPFVLSKGKRTLMYLKRNPFIKYIDNDSYKLTDGTNIYNLKFNDEYVEIIESKDYEFKELDKDKAGEFVIL